MRLSSSFLRSLDGLGTTLRDLMNGPFVLYTLVDFRPPHFTRESPEHLHIGGIHHWKVSMGDCIRKRTSWTNITLYYSLLRVLYASVEFLSSKNISSQHKERQMSICKQIIWFNYDAQAYAFIMQNESCWEKLNKKFKYITGLSCAHGTKLCVLFRVDNQ